MKFSRKGKKKNTTITAAVKVLEDISVALDKKQHCTFFFFFMDLFKVLKVKFEFLWTSLSLSEPVPQPVTQLSIVRRDPHVTLVQTAGVANSVLSEPQPSRFSILHGR